MRIHDQLLTSLLLMARLHNDSDMERSIVSAVHNIDHWVNDKQTLLHEAVSKNYPLLVDMLLNACADVNMKDEYGETALMLAVQKHNLEIVKKLVLSNASLEKKNDPGETALVVALKSPSMPIINFLLESGANPNAMNDISETALMVAVWKGAAVVGILAKHGASLNARDHRGWTPLMHAVHARRIESVIQLLDLKADAEIRNEDGLTALQMALDLEISDLVVLLQKHKRN